MDDPRKEGVLAYQSIENYGFIGNIYSAVLVRMDGLIDSLCYPNFASLSVFASILDNDKDGRKIAPCSEGHIQIVLLARYRCSDNAFHLTGRCGEIGDYMPVEISMKGHGHHQSIRCVNVFLGTMAFRMECRPAFNYVRDAQGLIQVETTLVPTALLSGSSGHIHVAFRSNLSNKAHWNN